MGVGVGAVVTKYKKVNLKQYLKRPGQALRVPGV